MATHINRRVALAGAAAGLALAGTEVQAQSAKPPAPLFPLPQTMIPIVGEERGFPVRRIYCIGRNYAAHSREMGAIQFVDIGSVGEHPYPSLTKNYHHEVELVAALKSGGRNIPVDQALQHVYGYAVGLDMTRRDLQREMGDQKKPWEIGKSFDHAAPIGPIHPVAKVGHPQKGAISLAVNGKVRQSADLNQMIWSVAEQIAHLSTAFELAAGDIIYSGTPENVGPVVKDDVLLCKIDGLPDMSIRIVAAQA
jgi:fumarylpyruvate hydrolase